jgi:hypothetical protein
MNDLEEALDRVTAGRAAGTLALRQERKIAAVHELRSCPGGPSPAPGVGPLVRSCRAVRWVDTPRMTPELPDVVVPQFRPDDSARRARCRGAGVRAGLTRRLERPPQGAQHHPGVVCDGMAARSGCAGRRQRGRKRSTVATAALERDRPGAASAGGRGAPLLSPCATTAGPAGSIRGLLEIRTIGGKATRLFGPRDDATAAARCGWSRRRGRAPRGPVVAARTAAAPLAAALAALPFTLSVHFPRRKPTRDPRRA